METLVRGVRTITWGCTACKPDTRNQAGTLPSNNYKQLQPKETLVYIRLVKWAMEALDIYTISTTPPSPGAPPQPGGPGGGGAGPGGLRQAPTQQTIRTKDEKVILEHFATMFSLLNPQTFKEVFSQVWSLTQFYSVAGFSRSRIGEKKSRFASAVFVGVFGPPPRLVGHP